MIKKPLAIKLVLVVIGVVVAASFVAVTVINDFSVRSKKANQYFQSDQFKTDLSRVSQTNQPIMEARQLSENGKWLEAIAKLEAGLKLKIENKLSEWVPRLRLVEAYEKAGDKDNALVHLGWLIERTDNVEKLQELKLRQQALLL